MDPMASAEKEQHIDSAVPDVEIEDAARILDAVILFADIIGSVKIAHEHGVLQYDRILTEF